jgi:PTH2 family peptidyl-tRNA hydrolase
MGLRSFIHRLTAPVITDTVPAGRYRLAIVVNTSLKMKKGKIAAQVGHGAVKAALDCASKNPACMDAWLSSGQAKICLKGVDDEQLLLLQQQAKDAGIQAISIRDAGRTQIPAGSLTVVAIGPARDDDLDPITGTLKLL